MSALLRAAAIHVVGNRYATVDAVQHWLGVDSARAEQLLDGLQAAGIVGPPRGPESRDVFYEPHEVDTVLAYLGGGAR